MAETGGPSGLRVESFEAFMGRALYDSQHGYYSCRIRDVGKHGDFSTSATLGPDLGIAVAHWIRLESRLHPGIRHVIEAGPGSGELSAVVRKELGFWERRRWTWHLVEASPVLRERQKRTLGDAVTWHLTMEEALKACGGEALIFHNELLDAFPVVRVEWREACWQEIWLEWTGVGHPKEVLRPVRVDPMDPYVVLRFQAKEGQRCELQRAVRDWLLGWAPDWVRGSVLAVDYGDEFPALYRRRPHGTLRAYLNQERSADVYSNVGFQDLTADVNFTDYRAWALQLGWECAGFQTQSEFLESYAPIESGSGFWKRRSRSPADRERSRFLRDPEGAGGAFRCVWHRK
jgi:SAM-dependent MidA family methyltransferase